MAAQNFTSITDWTTRGFRLLVTHDEHFTMFTCETQCTGVEEGTNVRSVWRVSQLGLVTAPRYEAERHVRHWVSFYEDEELSKKAVELVAALYDFLKERKGAPEQAAPPSKAGSSN